VVGRSVFNCILAEPTALAQDCFLARASRVDCALLLGPLAALAPAVVQVGALLSFLLPINIKVRLGDEDGPSLGFGRGLGLRLKSVLV